MLRSAAKNYKSVAVICNFQRYPEILAEMKKNNAEVSEKTCFSLAREVFRLAARYNKAIFDYLSGIDGHRKPEDKEFLPADLKLSFSKIQDLRYGENPHQSAAFYKYTGSLFGAITEAKQLHGKELSFNNIIDLDAAWAICNEFKQPAASVVKHTNPCGAACADELSRAYQDALDCDPLSAFGSVVGLNRKVDTETARRIAAAGFVECIIAPGYVREALEILKTRKNLRLIVIGPTKEGKELEIKNVTGGILLQEKDVNDTEKSALKLVTKKRPTAAQLQSLLFGQKIAKHVKSNSIVLARGLKTVGIGAGQMSRVDSVIIAVRKSKGRSKGAVLASDAFFPKADGVQTAAKGGVAAIIQPGGSIRDTEVIAAADELGVAMVFSGMRHFKH
jgi:phosphoribosylaminoimidazolecarboxamide formyltransferase/IMP cyclohydrolase